MLKHLEVIRRVLELSETVQEGIIHIQLLLKEGRFEKTIAVFDDVLNGIYSMEKALNPVLEEIPNNDLPGFMTNLRKALDATVSAYEQKQSNKVMEIVQFNLLPNYEKWQSELSRVLKPLILS